MVLFLLIGYINMETWRIAIPIVALILCALGSWYVVRLRLKEIKSRLYVYPKNGHYYELLFRCRMKYPASDEWFDAIIYQECNTERLYVRGRKDFFNKFIKLKDYENGSNSKQGVSEAH